MKHKNVSFFIIPQILIIDMIILIFVLVVSKQRYSDMGIHQAIALTRAITYSPRGGLGITLKEYSFNIK